MTATPNPQSGAYTALLENQVSLLGACIKELCEVVDRNNLSANIITQVIEEVKDDLHTMVQYMTETAEELVAAAKLAPTPSPQPPSQAFTYADTAQQKLPTVAAAKCLAQTKILKTTPPRDDPTASFKDLNKDVLLQKANLTLELIRKLGDTMLPNEADFILARKTAQGHILYEVDSVEMAEWLRSAEGTKIFVSKFGSDISLATKPFLILVEFVPIHFSTDDPSALRDVVQELTTSRIHQVSLLDQAH